MNREKLQETLLYYKNRVGQHELRDEDIIIILEAILEPTPTKQEEKECGCYCHKKETMTSSHIQSQCPCHKPKEECKHESGTNGKCRFCGYELDTIYRKPREECNHQFWKDRNPNTCLNCGKTEQELFNKKYKLVELKALSKDFDAHLKGMKDAVDDLPDFEKIVNSIFCAYSEKGYEWKTWNEKIAPELRKLKQLLSQHEAEIQKDKNCSCAFPSPSGTTITGKFEGHYMTCKICEGKVWG